LIRADFKRDRHERRREREGEGEGEREERDHPRDFSAFLLRNSIFYFLSLSKTL
jgi:hypothetical protein